jgi:hypothetical protein
MVAGGAELQRCTRRRVSPEDVAACEDKFNKSKMVHSIMRHVAETTNADLEVGTGSASARSRTRGAIAGSLQGATQLAPRIGDAAELAQLAATGRQAVPRTSMTSQRI